MSRGARALATGLAVVALAPLASAFVPALLLAGLLVLLALFGVFALWGDLVRSGDVSVGELLGLGLMLGVVVALLALASR